MGKKADMSMNTIVTAVLALMVLIILLYIFRLQITSIAGGFTSVGNDAKSGINGTKCQTILGGRICGEADNNKYKDMNEKYVLNEVPPPSNSKWSDCKNSNSCFEIGEKKEVPATAK